MADSPLRPDEYAVYSLLQEEGPLTPTQMARRLGMPATTISDYVRTLLERGHGERTEHPSDSRSYRVGLTRAGRRAHRTARTSFDAAMTRLRGVLVRPEAQVRAALGDLTQAARRSLLELWDEGNPTANAWPSSPTSGSG